MSSSAATKGELDNSEVLVTLENGTATVTVSGFANKPGTYTFRSPDDSLSSGYGSRRTERLWKREQYSSHSHNQRSTAHGDH